MRVGLLEDDIAIQEMLLLVLQESGYTVINFVSAEECLEKLRLSYQELGFAPLDLMIIDWRLYGSISGIEVIRQIRNDVHLQSLPIVLTTAATFTDLEELQDLHVALLQKPFSFDEITTLIRTLTQPRSAT
jgi:two-component system phosphate regulon response regulator PhoB